MDQQAHWDAVYETKPTDGVSWYAPHLDSSLALIEEAGLPLLCEIVPAPEAS